MQQWTREWIEAAILAAMRHADTMPADAQYTSFLAFLGGWLKEGGLSQEAQDALELLHRRANQIEE